jgi:hypothetical protein
VLQQTFGISFFEKSKFGRQSSKEEIVMTGLGRGFLSLVNRQSLSSPQNRENAPNHNPAPIYSTTKTCPLVSLHFVKLKWGQRRSIRLRTVEVSAGRMPKSGFILFVSNTLSTFDGGRIGTLPSLNKRSGMAAEIGWNGGNGWCVFKAKESSRLENQPD